MAFWSHQAFLYRAVRRHDTKLCIGESAGWEETFTVYLLWDIYCIVATATRAVRSAESAQCIHCKEGSIVSSYRLFHQHREGEWRENRKRHAKYLQLSLNSMPAGRVNSVLSTEMSWDLMRQNNTMGRQDNTKYREEKRTGEREDKDGGRRREECVSDLLSCCSPLIMGLTMPLSISSFPELCKHNTTQSVKQLQPHLRTYRRVGNDSCVMRLQIHSQN